MDKRLKFVLEIIAGLLIIGFLLSKIDLSKVLLLLSEVNLFWVVVGILVYVLTFLMTAYGLKVLFDSTVYISFKHWLKYYLITFSTGLMLPGRVGDLSLVYFLKDKKISTGTSAAFVVIDKMITLLVFGLIGLLGIFTIINSTELYAGLLVVLLVFVSCLLLFSKFGKRLFEVLLGKYSSNFNSFHDSYNNLIKFHRNRIWINISVTLLRPIFNGLLIVVLFDALRVSANLGFFSLLLYASIISSITLIVSLIPITPNGIGVREGVGLLLFNQLGISPEATISMYFIILMLNYLTGVLGIIYYFINKKPNRIKNII